MNLYNFLPLIVRLKDERASGSHTTSPILEQLIDALSQEKDAIDALIKGVRSLIDLDTTSRLYLTLIANLLGLTLTPFLEDATLREVTKQGVNSIKIKGLLTSWLRELKVQQHLKVTVTELYKNKILNENHDYSINKDSNHPYKSARVILTDEGIVY